MERFLKTMIFVLLIVIIWIWIAKHTSNLPTQENFDKVNQVMLVNNDLG